MAEIKIIRGSRISQAPRQMEQPIEQAEPISRQIPQQKQESAGPGLLSRLGISAVKGLEVPGQIVNQIAMALGEPSFIKKPLSEDIRGYIGATEEQLQPQGPIEKFSQRVLTQAPSAALFGPAALARTAVSAAPAVASGELGAPEWMQDLIQFGTDLTLGIRSGKIKNPSIKTAQKNAYDTARSLISDAERPGASKVVEALTDVGKNLGTETDVRTVKRVNHIISTVKDNFQPIFQRRGTKFVPGLNPKKAMDLRKKLYAAGRRYPDLIEYTKPLTEGINSFFAEHSASNPEFFEALTKGDKLTAARNMNSYIEKGFKALPIVGKKGAIGAIAGKFIGEGEKIARSVAFKPEVRDIYFDVVKSIAEGNVGLVAQKTDELLKQLEPSKELPVTQKSQLKGLKVLRGRRL